MLLLVPVFFRKIFPQKLTFQISCHINQVRSVFSELFSIISIAIHAEIKKAVGESDELKYQKMGAYSNTLKSFLLVIRLNDKLSFTSSVHCSRPTKSA